VGASFVNFCKIIADFVSGFAKDWVFSFIMEEPMSRAVFAQMQRHVVLSTHAP
jgi:hypothetical protein